ncbi:MAG: sigma-54 dependent transcriptional regulator [Labilithrix sp.]|nr:sigma-54 dependent transcriptional regulator [Labilithrix sp.]
MGFPRHDQTLATISEGPGEPAGPAPLFVLRVATGKDAGKSRVLDWNVAPRVLVGQSRLCELAVGDPRVSRRHLAIAPAGHGVRVTDLGSTNGTRVNGLRIVEALLTGGEAIDIGDSSIKLVRAGSLPERTGATRGAFGRVLGTSAEMERLFALAERLAPSPLPLLVEGETGTGKELLAEAIHEMGPRAGGPLVVHDCSAYAGDDALVALFGGTLAGVLEQAHGGTLVLDEVGDLPDAAQARLATFVERGILQRFAATPPVRVDVRIIATTRRDLERLVQDGAFREELLYRLVGARLELPPLRERRGDVEVLARHFWSLFGAPGALPRTFALTLAQYDWPGNVRELEHAIARRVALGDELSGALQPRSGGGASSGRRAGTDFLDGILEMNLAMPHARQRVIDEFEQRYVERAIAEHGGNVSRAAAASGLTRRYFHMLRSKSKKQGQDPK